MELGVYSFSEDYIQTKEEPENNPPNWSKQWDHRWILPLQSPEVSCN